MTWVSGLPAVVTTAAAPLWVTPKNVCPAAEARQASTATWTSPSVPFLNPTGIDRPEASWRWTWLSVVRAPIAPQAAVHVVAAVHAWVVDQALPAGHGARFLEVDAHHDQQVGLVAQRPQPGRVVQGRERVVHRTRPGDDQQPVIGAVQDGADFGPGAFHRVRGLLAQPQFVEQGGRGQQRLVAGDAGIPGARHQARLLLGPGQARTDATAWFSLPSMKGEVDHVTEVCEHGAASHDGTESSAASAPEASRARLLIEHPGPWPHEPAESVLPPPLASVVGAADALGVRVQMIRRPGRGRIGTTRSIYAGWTEGPEPWLRHAEWSQDRPGPVAALDLEKLAAGSA